MSKIGTFFSSKEGQLLTLIFLPSIIYYGNFISRLYGSDGFFSYLYGLIAIYSFYIIVKCLKSNNGQQVAKYAFLVMLLLFSAFFVHSSGKYIIGDHGISIYSFFVSDLGNFFNLVLPIIFLYIAGAELECILTKPIWISRIIILLQLIAYILVIQTSSFTLLADDYMSFAYYGFLPVVILFYNKNSIINLCFFAVGSIALVVVGCRGAMLTFFSVILLYSVLKYNITKWNTLFFLIIIIALFSLMDFNSLLSGANNQLESIGFSSRTLTKILSSEDVFYSSEGRDEITQVALQNLSILPYGLWGDRQFSNTYVHNWILEVLLDFGLVLGGILLLVVIVINIKAIKTVKHSMNSEYIGLLSLSMALVWVKFLISSSFLIDSGFVLSISMLLYINKNKGFTNV